jgi:hypothetical protein
VNDTFLSAVFHWSNHEYSNIFIGGVPLVERTMNSTIEVFWMHDVWFVVPHFPIIADDTDPQQNNVNNSNPKSNRMNAAMDHPLDTITSTELATMDNLQNDIMISQILPFIGDGNYRYIGLVNRKIHQNYTTLYPTKTTYYNGSTIAHARLCFQSMGVHHELVQ